MKHEEYISIQELCVHYKVEISFFNRLKEYGLVEVRTVNRTPCLHRDGLPDMERVLRLQNELNLDLDAIDTVFNLLERIKRLEEELNETRSRLGIYE